MAASIVNNVLRDVLGQESSLVDEGCQRCRGVVDDFFFRVG